jgi:hypothetical protein
MTNNKQQTEMNKEFIPYELALELKQLGFDEPCLASIDQTDFIHIKGTEYPIRGAMIYDTIDCPTYSQAFRWFREKYDIDIYIDIRFLKHDDGISLKKYKVLIPFPNELFIDVGLFTTHEEAELECLKKLIEIIKNK